MAGQEKSKEPLSPSKRRKDKRKDKRKEEVEIKYTTNVPGIEEVVRKIIAEGGPPSETTSERIVDKAVKILGGGAEFKGGGRAVMKKGGKV